MYAYILIWCWIICLIFFKTPQKKKVGLQVLLNELNYTHKYLKRYYKICWLSRWKVVITMCDSLELVLTSLYISLRDILPSPDDGSNLLAFSKLSNFKFIYVLYFLADILYMLFKLSKIFQSKFVDISSIGSIVKTKIISIRLYFLVDSCDLNQATFK